uniref:Cell death activator CIDE-B n=1 Tax=Cacopsylla melanoneura TaxID=428564 RepID=A0A8D8LZG2_9HEMI
MTDESQRPYKIVDVKRERKVGVVAKSLEEIKSKAQNKLSNPSSNIKVVLESDGTEIDEEDYFSTLENDTALMVLFDNEKWTPVRQLADAVDGVGHPLTELLSMLKQDIGQVSLLGGQELELLSDMDPDNLLDIIPDRMFLNQVKEASCRFLSDKRNAQEALDLLKLYHRSYINNENGTDITQSKKSRQT